ncbi:GTPase HflX [Blautia stercoris]|uniref:GTPase HflX n=1 Tax=Blautia stercoris TaxID=871664 RepID=A0ABR7P851_9FIRM|nr:GTPase HflX [Blautia stercoris]MBC8627567.1 GTPase HflX [Blautia stercoris]RGF23199.1 GTPase HflX [Firmicutes bacterium AM10-47]RHV45768.1 GTPase HflX [Firmicutes bacterium OM04-13BH]
MELFDLSDKTERVILVGVQENDGDDTEESLQELAELAKTAGAEVVGTVIQKRERIHPGTYVGKGKIDEIRTLLNALDATGIICDDELSPVQMNHLQQELESKIMDRTLLILDIFASRAVTKEGKIQVELAQLRYRAVRLVGLGSSLSRLGGGIGTRGPGEKKLEMDRRLIKERISQLKKELEHVKKHRELLREGRKKDRVMTAAIVGYTNAGKSTLLNTLTDAGVLSEDKLFATLDPTTRLLELDGGQRIYLTDTVGFIRKLPHHLIEAFKSTLEEAKYADVILHVVDASNPQVEEQMFIVYETLRELGVKDKTIVTLFNKQDRLAGNEILRDFKADYVLKISARTGLGLDELKNTLEKILIGNQIYIERVLDYKDAGMLQLVRKYGQLIEEKYTENGIEIKARVPKDIYGRLGE